MPRASTPARRNPRTLIIDGDARRLARAVDRHCHFLSQRTVLDGVVKEIEKDLAHCAFVEFSRQFGRAAERDAHLPCGGDRREKVDSLANGAHEIAAAAADLQHSSLT